MELPDGSVITIEKEDDRKQIEEWYVNNPDSKERATFVFPIDIEIFEKKENEEDSKVLTINDEEELKKFYQGVYTIKVEKIDVKNFTVMRYLIV